jgi:hypothetical protein
VVPSDLPTNVPLDPTTAPATPAPSVFCETTEIACKPPGEGWELLLSSDLNGGPGQSGDFNDQPYGGCDGKNYRVALTTQQLQAEGFKYVKMTTISGENCLLTPDESEITNWAGFGSTQKACNDDGAAVAPGLYWFTGENTCYASPHFGLSTSKSVHTTCDGYHAETDESEWVQSWYGHFHRHSKNTGVYTFGLKCIEEEEGQARFYLWANRNKSFLSLGTSN